MSTLWAQTHPKEQMGIMNTRDIALGSALKRKAAIIVPTVVRCLLGVALIGVVASGPAWSANGTTTITMSPGNSISITITPVTETVTEDVVSPGANWTFRSSAQSWYPAGVVEGFDYTPSSAPGCTTAAVTTFKKSWGLTAYVTLSPSSAPLAVYLADATSACTTPAGTAVAISTSSSSPTTLASSQSDSQTKKYYLMVAPTGGTAISGTTTITITYTAN